MFGDDLLRAQGCAGDSDYGGKVYGSFYQARNVSASRAHSGGRGGPQGPLGNFGMDLVKQGRYLSIDLRAMRLQLTP